MGAIQSAINRSLVTTSALVGLYKQSVKMDEEKMKQATERSENQKLAKIKQRANLQNQRARLTEARARTQMARTAILKQKTIQQELKEKLGNGAK